MFNDSGIYNDPNVIESVLIKFYGHNIEESCFLNFEVRSFYDDYCFIIGTASNSSSLTSAKPA